MNESPLKFSSITKFKDMENFFEMIAKHGEDSDIQKLGKIGSEILKKLRSKMKKTNSLIGVGVQSGKIKN